MKRVETERLSAASRRTGFFVWLLMLLVVACLLMFAAQPAHSLKEGTWVRPLSLAIGQITPAFRVLLAGALLLGYLPLILALKELGHLARAYARGKIFVEEAVRRLTRAGWLLIAVPVALPAVMMLFSGLLQPLGIVQSPARIAIQVQVESFLIAAIGLVLRLVALAMQDAVVIAREHSEYV